MSNMGYLDEVRSKLGIGGVHNDEGFGPFKQKTYRKDGTIASSFDGFQLVQYDNKGQVRSVEKIDINTQVTYRNGEIAAIEKKDILQGRSVTLYENGKITTSIALNKDDQVNFHNGYLSSIIKQTGDGVVASKQITETQYGQNGKITSVIHKAQMGNIFNSDANMWVVTSQSNYHDNGKLASVVTYKQKHKRKEESTFVNLKKEEETESYPASIEQYDENGKCVISVRLSEKDEVNFNGDKISSITRRNEQGKPQSTTTYDTNGMVVNVLNYDKNGKVVSSIDYDEKGRPTRALQEGMENYQNIFENLRVNKR